MEKKSLEDNFEEIECFEMSDPKSITPKYLTSVDFDTVRSDFNWIFHKVGDHNLVILIGGNYEKTKEKMEWSSIFMYMLESDSNIKFADGRHELNVNSESHYFELPKLNVQRKTPNLVL